jgi:beta-lactamase class D
VQPDGARRARSGAISAIALAVLLVAESAGGAPTRTSPAGAALLRDDRPAADSSSCFLLYEVGVGMRRREPARACGWRLSPASTFKVPHAIAALDAGVVSGPDEVIRYDGTGSWPELSRHDHTPATTISYSVVWYFHRVASRLGMERERSYLTRLDFGNADPSSGRTTFWLGGSLAITPDEQLRCWRRLHADSLPVPSTATQQVRDMLIEPNGAVVNALGEQPFALPRPAGTVVSAKTGATNDRRGRGIRWLVGHVRRGAREYLFASCVVGTTSLSGDAAIRLAESGLRAEGVL